MTSPSTASDRHSFSAAAGRYTSGLSGISLAASSRSAPAVGDAFADVFRMIASAQSPPATDRVNDTSDYKSDDARTSTDPETRPEAAESENEIGDEADMQTAVITDVNALLNTTDPDSESTDTPNNPDPEIDALAEQDADSDTKGNGDAFQLHNPRVETAEISPTVAAVAVNAEQESQVAADAPAGPEATKPLASLAVNETAQTDPTDNIASGRVVPGASTNSATDVLKANTPAVEESLVQPTATEGSDEDSTATVRYAGIPEEGSDRKRDVSNRRHHGERHKTQPNNDAQAASLTTDAARETTPQVTTSNRTPVTQTPDPQAPTVDAFAFGEVSAAPASATQTITTAAITQAQPAAVSSGAATSLKSATELAGPSRSHPQPTTATETNPRTETGTQGAAKETNDGPRVADRALLVQRVSRAFQRLGVDGGQVRIRLHPEALGSVQVQLNVQGQRMSARVVAETEAARTILTQHLPELRQRLSDQGMQVERLDVHLEGERDASDSKADFLNRDPTGQGRPGQGGAGQGGAGQGRGALARNLHRPPANAQQTADITLHGGAHGQGVRTVIQAAQQKSVDLIG